MSYYIKYLHQQYNIFHKNHYHFLVALISLNPYQFTVLYYTIKKILVKTNIYLPVEPNPPLPLTVSESSLTKAKDIIRDYKIVVEGDHTTVCSVPEENRCINVLKLNEQKQFINNLRWKNNQI